MYNIVTVTFKDSNTATANGVRQWDYGQILRIQGLQLPTAVEVHFALIDSKDSVTRIGITKDGVTDVVIPDSMIEAGKNIFAYVYLRDSESGQTEYEIKIVVTTRAKPEAFDTPEDKELFAQAIEAVNEAADRAEKAGQAATEAAGQAAEDAQQTAQDRAEVAKMVETVTDISEQVKKVEELSNKAQESATQAGASAVATEKAKAQAETAAGKTAEDRTAVNQAKIAVDEVQEAVRADRAAVEEVKQSVEQLSNAIPESTQAGVQAVNQARQTAVDEIARTGTSHKTAVEGAGTQAVESVENVQQVATEAVETAKTEAVQAVQAEGAKQIKEVQDKGAEVLQSIPEDFATQMETKLNKQQGIENKGKVLVIEEDGNVVPGEVASGGGDGIAIINTMSGKSPLVIPDSAERVNKRLELGGKTEQVQTSGKNLIDYKKIVVGLLNFVDGTFSGIYHTYFTTDFIEIESGDYVISHNSNVGIQSYALYDINNKTYVSGKAGNNKVNVLNKCLIRISFNTKPETDVSSNPIDYAKKCNIQLEKGTTATPYEQYTGGKPSPSPEYPQEIKNSGKWNEETQKYEVDVKITGKNLLNLQKEPDVKGTYQGWKVGNGELLTLGVKDKGNNADIKGCYIGFSDQGSESKGVVWVVDNGVIKTNPLNQRKAYVSIFPANETTVKKLTERFDIQCELGNVATPYQPYKEQTLTLTSDRPLTKWDRLVEQGGQIGWLYAGVVIDRFDGQSNKISIANKQGNVQNFSIRFENVANGNGNSDIFVDKYRAVQLSYTKAEYGICCNWNDGVKYFSAPNENVATVDEFKAWLIENPLKIAYETTNPEFIPLPQSEQNAIRALKTYYPTTVITVDGGEVDPDIKVTYTADTKNYIDGKVSAKVASIIRQYRLNTANLLSLMPMETQAAMIENDTNNILENAEEMKRE